MKAYTPFGLGKSTDFMAFEDCVFSLVSLTTLKVIAMAIVVEVMKKSIAILAFERKLDSEIKIPKIFSIKSIFIH